MAVYVNGSDGILKVIPLLEFDPWDDYWYIFNDVDVNQEGAVYFPQQLAVGGYYHCFSVNTALISPAIETPVQIEIWIIRESEDRFGIYTTDLGVMTPEIGVNTGTTNLTNRSLWYVDGSGQTRPEGVHWGQVDAGETVGGTHVTRLTFWLDGATLLSGDWAWDVPGISYHWNLTNVGWYPTVNNAHTWAEVDSVAGGPLFHNIEFSRSQGTEVATILNCFCEGIIGAGGTGVPISYHGTESGPSMDPADNYDWGQANIGLPDLPTSGLLDSGLVALYNPTTAQIKTLAQYLASSSFWDNVLKTFSDPLQSIITLHMLPVDPDYTDTHNIILGGLDTGISATRCITSNFIRRSFGSVDIDERFRSFLDYSGSKLSIHLPYAGFVELPASVWLASKMTLALSLDLFTGAGVYVMAWNAEGTLYRKNVPVNMSLPVPLTSLNYTGVYAGLIGAAASLASGNVAGTVQQLMNLHVDSERSGSPGSAYGAMDSMYAFVALDSPNQQLPARYEYYAGRPNHIYHARLAEVTGYTECDIYLSDAANLNDYERDEIRRVMREGSYL